ncbi:MAG: hypothetical protein AAF456_13635 [Planctomycetota bacterium]
MRRRKQDDDGAAMDSLLDTMTNVVGILVIVLVVTQLGVGDAVERITANLIVDEEKIEEDRAKLLELEQQMQMVQISLEQLDPDEPQDESVNEEIEALRQQISDDEVQLRNLRRRNADDEAQLARMKEEQEAERIKREQLETDIESALGESARLRATLDDTPEREVLTAHEMRLPDPREAPEGLKQFALICCGNRIYPLKFHPIALEAREKAAQVIRARRLDENLVAGIDPETFVREFNRRPMRNEFYDIEMFLGANGDARLRLTPKDDEGARIRDVERRNSRFNKDLRELDPNEYYLRFFVCSDSYDVYLSARAMAEENGLSVGWIPVNPDWKFAGALGGDIVLGPPKPATPPPANPNPNPPPRPVEEID